MIDLIQESWGVVERLYDRLGTKSARGLDLDAAVVLTQCAAALEKRLNDDLHARRKNRRR